MRFMTGRYAWRQPGTGIAAGNAPALIKPGTTTVPSLLKQAGYTTGVVGKWHLGLGDAARPISTARSSPARWSSALTTPSSFPPPATACPACSSRTTASSATIPADPIQVSYGNKIGDEPDRQRSRT